MEESTLDLLPDVLKDETVYTILPANTDSGFYKERTDRQLGWLSAEEQQIIQQSTIGFAGVGGMGGLTSSIMLRAGVQMLKLADCDIFDVSNINRQFGATKDTVGKSKILETARELKRITDDNTLILYPQGINQQSVDHFVKGCSVIVDALEFWAIGSRILLHKAARKHGIPVFNVCPVGFGYRLFLFTSESIDIERFLGMSYEEAATLEQKQQDDTITEQELKRIRTTMVCGFIPSVTRYADNAQEASNLRAIAKRTENHHAGASVLASNIACACGALSNYIILLLIQPSSVVRKYTNSIPVAPDYIYFDAAKSKFSVRRNRLFETIRKQCLRWILSRY